MFKLQPAQYVDQIKDGHEMTKLPYPFFVEKDGSIGQQELWKGDPLKAIGFQVDLAKQQIDLWWDQVARDPQRVVGMYLVTSNAQGNWGVHQTAIVSVEEIS